MPYRTLPFNIALERTGALVLRRTRYLRGAGKTSGMVVDPLSHHDTRPTPRLPRPTERGSAGETAAWGDGAGR
jgi:hypothetical protein